MTTCTCDHCGSIHITKTPMPDGIRIECGVCGTVEWIWRDDEYDDPPSAPWRPPVPQVIDSILGIEREKGTK
jgi:ribosomal protein S27AE